MSNVEGENSLGQWERKLRDGRIAVDIEGPLRKRSEFEDAILALPDGIRDSGLNSDQITALGVNISNGGNARIRRTSRGARF